MARPNFTAYLVALILGALSKDKRWGALVPKDAQPVYAACVRECMGADTLYKALYALPNPLKIVLMDRMVVAGYAQHLALRKMAVEQQVRSNIASGCTQVVVIGAGFDALCTRLAGENTKVQCFELDMAPTQDTKRKALARAGIAEVKALHFVPCDLSKASLEQVLGAYPDFTRGAPTIFVAEGLSMYLTAEENLAWLKSARALGGPGSGVIFTAIEKLDTGDNIGESVRDQVLKRRGERFRWAIHTHEMAAFVAQAGWSLQYEKRYEALQQPYRTAKENERLARQNGEHVFYASVSS